jgi:hypothetical protein
MRGQQQPGDAPRQTIRASARSVVYTFQQSQCTICASLRRIVCSSASPTARTSLSRSGATIGKIRRRGTLEGFGNANRIRTAIGPRRRAVAKSGA